MDMVALEWVVRAEKARCPQCSHSAQASCFAVSGPHGATAFGCTSINGSLARVIEGELR